MRAFQLILLSLIGLWASASRGEELFYSNEKIYVVVAVVLIILIGLGAYLFRLERKIDKLEKRNED